MRALLGQQLRRRRGEEYRALRRGGDAILLRERDRASIIANPLTGAGHRAGRYAGRGFGQRAAYGRGVQLHQERRRDSVRHLLQSRLLAGGPTIPDPARPGEGSDSNSTRCSSSSMPPTWPQAEEELRGVLAHVEAKLQQHGIRYPRMFPVSSLQALDGKRTGVERLIAESSASPRVRAGLPRLRRATSWADARGRVRRSRSWSGPVGRSPIGWKPHPATRRRASGPEQPSRPTPSEASPDRGTGSAEGARAAAARS